MTECIHFELRLLTNDEAAQYPQHGYICTECGTFLAPETSN